MRVEAIHRVIEERAAASGDAVAIVTPSESLSFRELNGRANVLARQLLDAGLRRCGHAVVAQAPRTELIATLLAILKTGSSYSWMPSATPIVRCGDSHAPAEGEGVSILSGIGGDVQRRLPPLALPPGLPCQPNLPILTRGADIACSMPRAGATVRVPHSTVLSLRSPAIADVWRRDDAAIGVWVMLMAGMPVTVDESYAAAA